MHIEQMANRWKANVERMLFGEIKCDTIVYGTLLIIRQNFSQADLKPTDGGHRSGGDSSRLVGWNNPFTKDCQHRNRQRQGRTKFRESISGESCRQASDMRMHP